MMNFEKELNDKILKHFIKIENPTILLIKDDVRSKKYLFPEYQLGHLYNGLSKIYGYRNWNTFSAFLKTKV